MSNGSRESPSSTSGTPRQSGHVTFSPNHSTSQGSLPPPHNSGNGTQLLICTEQLSSSTPPSDDSVRSNSQEDGLVWKGASISELAVKNSQHLGATYSIVLTHDRANNVYKSGSLVSNSANSGNLTSENLSVIQNKGTESGLQLLIRNTSNNVIETSTQGNEAAAADERMSSRNGFDRNRVTGPRSGLSGENATWLVDSSGNQSRVAAASTTLSARDAGARSIISGSAGTNPHVTMASVFRPPLTIADPTQRQYGAIYSTAGASPTLGPYSPLYTSHGQSSMSLSAMSPYSAFYSQYPGYASSGSLLSGYQHIESYSAVLQSMGSHAAQSSQLPRGSTYASGPISQYSILGPAARSLTPTSSASPGPSSREEMELRREHEQELHRRHSTSFIKEEKSHFSPPRGSLSSLRESPNPKRDELYKVPSGKEGSLKHRILTRPSDTPGTSSSVGTTRHCSFSFPMEISPKPTKKPSPVSLSSARSVSLSNSRSDLYSAGPGPPSHGQSQPSEDRGPGQRRLNEDASDLRYPPHFIKGSIIQLANGELKRVEDLKTEDFVHSAEISNDLRIDSSTVANIDEHRDRGTAVLRFVVGEHKVQVTVEATMEHPFYVFGQGWSSCDPSRTLQRYGLRCQKLSVGDVCISLTHKEVTARAAEISQQQQLEQRLAGKDEHKDILQLQRGEKVPDSVQDQGQGDAQSQASGSLDQRQASGMQGQNEKVKSHKGDKDSSDFLIPDWTVSPTQTQEQRSAQMEKMDSVPPRKRRWSASGPGESDEPVPEKRQQEFQDNSSSKEKS